MGTPQQQQQLIMAVHHVATPTAKVPFGMILLLDFAKRRATPAGCKCRMVLPSDGETSVSLWDTQDPQALLEWLNDNLGADCTTVLHEVQEDFTFGLALDLARMRAADKVADGSLKLTGALGETTSRAAGALAAGVTTAVGSTQARLEEFDQRTGVLTGAKETSAAIAQRAIGVMSKAAEDQRVQGLVTNVSTGWAKLSSWVGERIKDINVADGSQENGQQRPRGYSPSQEQVHMPSQYAPSSGTQSHTLGGSSGGSSADGGGIIYTSSADQPLASTKSMLEEPTAAAAPAAPAAARGVTSSPAAAGAGGVQ